MECNDINFAMRDKIHPRRALWNNKNSGTVYDTSPYKCLDVFVMLVDILYNIVACICV